MQISRNFQSGQIWPPKCSVMDFRLPYRTTLEATNGPLWKILGKIHPALANELYINVVGALSFVMLIRLNTAWLWSNLWAPQSWRLRRNPGRWCCSCSSWPGTTRGLHIVVLFDLFGENGRKLTSGRVQLLPIGHPGISGCLLNNAFLAKVSSSDPGFNLKIKGFLIWNYPIQNENL